MECREFLCRCSCNIYAYWLSVTGTNIAAVPTCLLVECCCKMDACWPVATQSACLTTFCHSILQLILLVWCFTISRACWCGVSLSAVPAGMVSHYWPYLLVWCLTIGCACWYGVSLSAVPAGLVSHYLPCLL